MSSADFDSARTLKAIELMRKIAERIEAGATVPPGSSDFYQQTRERLKDYKERTIISKRQLAYIEGIAKRCRVKK